MRGRPLSIVIIHGVADATRPDEQDTLDQCAQVFAALTSAGHDVTVRSTGLGLDALQDIPPDSLVFNLVEAIAGDGRLIHLVPAALDHLGRAYTGSGPTALLLSSSKTLSKLALRAAGLVVPETLSDPEAHNEGELYIVKSEWEDASFGIDARSVVSKGRVADEVAARQARFGGDWFAERFIDGREFNISVLADGDELRVLPPAEIVFRDYPEGRPRIVDYEAKWDAGSFAYNNTVRRFVDTEAEPELSARLADAARRAFWALDLRDYGRIDFRLAEDGTLVVLEANANPCLSSDAGFVAAAAAAGMPYDELIGAIVDAARSRMPAQSAPAGDGSQLSRSAVIAAEPATLTKRAARLAGPVKRDRRSSVWRHAVEATDIADVRDLVARTGFFTDAEVGIAAELVEERLAKGPASGYEFVLQESSGGLVGYTCFGLIPGSDISWDLYWIAVDPESQGQGLGRRLLSETERVIREAGGVRLYADTSSSPRYEPTRAYYLSAGFHEAGRLEDFYRSGDGKVIYEKLL